MKHDEGQQQQEIVEDPNWDSVKITTQKPNVNINKYYLLIIGNVALVS